MLALTVLGKSPAWQDADGACSGYLLTDGSSTLLLDCGSGVFAKLRAHADPATVENIVITHLHADHFFDLIPFAYALTLTDRFRSQTDPDRKIGLYLPPDGLAAVRQLGSIWGRAAFIEEVFEVNEYDPNSTIEMASLLVKFQLVPHYVPTYAVDIQTAVGPGRITFGADHGPSEQLIAFASDTDLLLIEATLEHPQTQQLVGHITPIAAGQHGRQAGAKRLVLTHISDLLDNDNARIEAERAYGQAVQIAREGQTYVVPDATMAA